MDKFTIEDFVKKEVVCLEIFFDNMLIHGEIDYSDIENLTDETEIFNWYRVSELLYRKLKEKNQPVCKFGFYCFWGRTTFGQSIDMDGVIQEIFAEILAEFPFLKGDF